MKIENFCCAAAELQNKMTGTTKMSQIYYYRAYEEETLSDMLTTGFFNNAQDRVKKDDLIILYYPNTDGNQEIAYSKVVSNIGGVVTIAEIPMGVPQVNADWDAVSGVAEILNKPTLGTMAAESASDYTKTEDLATVATTGDYDDLDNKPTIPTVNNSTITLTQGGVTKGSFTLNQSSDDTIDFDAGGGSSRNVGEIVASTIPLTDAGLHLLDGSLIQGGGIYDDFVTYIAGLVSTYPDCFTTEAAWQQSVTDYGVCGKFVYDSVNNTVRLPKISLAERYLIKSYHSGDDWYRVYSDGWCEQGGLVYIPSSDLTVTFLIPFLNTDYTITAGSSNNTNVVNVNQNNARTTTTTRFDMSGSNSGNAFWQACGYVDISSYSTKEEYEYIVVATSVKTEIEIDIDEIVADLDNKANKNLSNVTASGKETVAGWPFPSTAYEDLTLGASGTEYTAPASGYYTLYKTSSAANQFIQMINIDNTNNKTPLTNVVIRAHANGDYVGCIISCKKGNKVIINYTLGGATQYFRFCYADGEM